MKLLNFTQNVVNTWLVHNQVTYTGTFQIDPSEGDAKYLICAYLDVLTGRNDNSYLNTTITPGPANTYYAQRTFYQADAFRIISELLLEKLVEATGKSSGVLQELLLRSYGFTQRLRPLLNQNPKDINLLINWESFEIDTIENPISEPFNSFKLVDTTIHIYIG